MSDLVRRVTWDRIKKSKKVPEFRPGDTIGVYVKVKEGEKERVQLYSGVVLKMQGSGPSRTFTVPFTAELSLAHGFDELGETRVYFRLGFAF